MRSLLAGGRSSVHGEDAQVAVRAVLGLSAGVGVIATAMVAATGGVPIMGLPTLLLLVCLVVCGPVGAAYAAAGVWLALAPVAQGEALLAPLAMAVCCVAIALGPERLASWLERESAAASEGWIEEDGRRID